MLTIEQKSDLFDRILEMLQEEMDLEQVNYCKYCHFWGTAGERTEGGPLFNNYIRQCRKYGEEKIYSDYCSDGIRACRNSI